MTLPNSQLEQVHTEMKSLLTERQGELARDGGDDHSRDVSDAESLSNEIDAWEKKAQDVPEAPDDDEKVRELEASGREICSKLEALHRT